MHVHTPQVALVRLRAQLDLWSAQTSRVKRLERRDKSDELTS